MLVREIMTSPAYRVHESASLEAALQTLVTTRVTSLPVVDAGGRLVGIISEADVLREHLAADPRAHIRVVPPESGPLPTTVGQVMTAHPHTVREDSDVAELAQTFAQTSWKSVPVVEGDLLLGVVSRSDVIRAMARPDSEIAAEVSEAFAEIGQHAWHADVVDRMVHITGTASERERAAATSIAQSILGVRRVTSEEPQA
ncbi:MAG: CBS domain-containing protein [Actinobacteria bacterium]|nr:CBS domain-containing protein [Actinomycetota bacterium]